MCCVPCGPRRRSSSRVEIIPVQRITKARVDEIIFCGDFDCLYKKGSNSTFVEYEGCSMNLSMILHDGKTKVKVAGSRTPGYSRELDTVVMTAPCVDATILIRTRL